MLRWKSGAQSHSNPYVFKFRVGLPSDDIIRRGSWSQNADVGVSVRNVDRFTGYCFLCEYRYGRSRNVYELRRYSKLF
jgi:hypothetical protein